MPIIEYKMIQVEGLGTKLEPEVYMEDGIKLKSKIKLPEYLRNAGRQGWELISLTRIGEILDTGGRYMYGVFKRVV